MSTIQKKLREKHEIATKNKPKFSIIAITPLERSGRLIIPSASQPIIPAGEPKARGLANKAGASRERAGSSNVSFIIYSRAELAAYYPS